MKGTKTTKIYSCTGEIGEWKKPAYTATTLDSEHGENATSIQRRNTKCAHSGHFFRNPSAGLLMEEILQQLIRRNIRLLTGFYTSQVVVWDFFHQQYLNKVSNWSPTSRQPLEQKQLNSNLETSTNMTTFIRFFTPLLSHHGLAFDESSRATRAMGLLSLPRKRGRRPDQWDGGRYGLEYSITWVVPLPNNSGQMI